MAHFLISVEYGVGYAARKRADEPVPTLSPARYAAILRTADRYPLTTR
jgi:hypothetical protein